LHLQTGYEVIFPGVLNANGFQMLDTTLDHYRGLIRCRAIMVTRLTG